MWFWLSTPVVVVVVVMVVATVIIIIVAVIILIMVLIAFIIIVVVTGAIIGNAFQACPRVVGASTGAEIIGAVTSKHYEFLESLIRAISAAIAVEACVTKGLPFRVVPVLKQLLMLKTSDSDIVKQLWIQRLNAVILQSVSF